jgi:hypothetical protein
MKLDQNKRILIGVWDCLAAVTSLPLKGDRDSIREMMRLSTARRRQFDKKV